MGRYAFFSSGFEYKFGYGFQSSEDIQLFGGLGNIHGNRFHSEPYHEWKQHDLTYIEERLHAIEELCSIPHIDIESFRKSIDGTDDLRSKVRELYDIIPNEKMVGKYMIGCLIYHQLLYTKELSVTYEL